MSAIYVYMKYVVLEMTGKITFKSSIFSIQQIILETIENYIFHCETENC